MDMVLEFLVSVAANIVASCVSKWLDRRDGKR